MRTNKHFCLSDDTPLWRQNEIAVEITEFVLTRHPVMTKVHLATFFFFTKDFFSKEQALKTFFFTQFISLINKLYTSYKITIEIKSEQSFEGGKIYNCSLQLC